MPIYTYDCEHCAIDVERIVHVDARDEQLCRECGWLLRRHLEAPLFRFKGRVTPGGGPDKFTADMLGIPLHDLPTGLRSDSSSS